MSLLSNWRPPSLLCVPKVSDGINGHLTPSSGSTGHDDVMILVRLRHSVQSAELFRAGFRWERLGNLLNWIFFSLENAESLWRCPNRITYVECWCWWESGQLRLARRHLSHRWAPFPDGSGDPGLPRKWRSTFCSTRTVSLSVQKTKV